MKKNLLFAVNRGALTLAAGLLVFLTFVTLANGQADLPERHATGLRRPTPADREWMEKNMVKVKTVHLNKLAVDRINSFRRNQGLPPINPPVAPIGEEYEVEGSIGLASAKTPSAAGVLPPAVDNSALPSFPPVRNQGQIGSCTSFSTTYYVATHTLGLARGWNNKNNDNSTKLSPKWTYPMVNGGGNEGSTFPDTLRVLLKHGAATWADFPYSGEDISKNYREWSRDAGVWRRAVAYRMKETGIIRNVHTPAGLNDLKTFLANGYCVLYSTDIEGWQYDRIKDDPSTTADDPFVGKRVCTFVKAKESGHAMTVVGYNDNLWVDLNKNGVVDPGEKGALRICNSWGTGWGDTGFVWLSYDALKAVSAVSGANNTDRVPGAFPGDPWRTAFWDNEVFFVSARAAYTPKLLAQFTLNHASRKQLKISLGRSLTTVANPTITWEPAAINEQGGNWGFDGSANAVNGTFVFDFSDIATGGPSRYYLIMKARASPKVATLSDFRLIDANGNTLAVATAGVPSAADNSTALAYVDYTLNALTITSGSATNGTIGVPLSFTVTATGNPTSFGASGLPPGLTINATAGVISGTPTDAGKFVASLSVSSSQAIGSGTLTFTIAHAIVNPPAITSSTTASGSVGASFTYRITANGSPLLYGATELPPGLSLNESTGLIVGTPTHAGTFTATVSASNAGGTGTRALTITISPPPLPAPEIISATTATVQAGSPFSYRIIARNDPTSYGAEGLPSELTLNTSSGLIAGTLRLAREYSITLSAKNGAGTGYAKLILTVLGESSFAPANDSFRNRSALIGTNLTVTGGNHNATAQSGEPAHAGFPASKSVWWTWTAPSAGTVTLSTVGSDFDTVLAVYTGTNVAALTLVASDDNSGANDTSKLTFNATDRVGYEIVVDGRNDAVGNIVLNLQFAGGITAPANDNFANRTPLSGVTLSASGRNIGAGAEAGEPKHVGFAASKSVWWTWTAPSAGWVTINTAGSDFDTLLAVYTGADFQSLTAVASDDQNGPNSSSEVAFAAAAGQTYQIAVDGFEGAAGTIMLNLELKTGGNPPPNDDFDKRISLNGGSVSTTGSNLNATAQTGEPDHAEVPAERSVWWSWTAPAAGVVTVTTAGSNFDTVLAVYTGTSLSGLAGVASNDDEGSQITSSVTFTATSGTTYQIAVDGFDESDKTKGSISLKLELRSGGPPNDNFANRIQLNGTNPSTAGANVNATAETGEPRHDDNLARKSVWWSWTAPSGGRMTLTTEGSSFDTILAIYTGTSLAGLVPVASNDEDGEKFTSRVSFLATAGTSYPIAVDGYEGASGTIRLAGNLVDLGDVLYETDFETFSSGANELVGSDGWNGVNAGGGVQGIAEVFDELGQGAYLGLNAPTNRFVSIFRPVNFDAVGQGRPLVNFSVEMAIGDSTNGKFDVFAFSLYNRAGQFLASILFDNDDGKISVANGDNSVGDTGQTFEDDTEYTLNATINFAANTWSATLDEVPLVQNKPLNVDGRTLDLGYIALEWRISDPSKAGDNFLVFDDYSLSASASAKAPTILAQPQSRTVQAGEAAIFSVAASGTPPLLFQWQFNGNKLPGETNATLFINNVRPTDAGSYAVAVQNRTGSITSNPAVLTVAATNVLPTSSLRLQISLAPKPKIEWTSTVGLSYRVQFTPSLTSPSWAFLTAAIPGTGGTLSFIDSAATDQQRFYRLVQGQP